MPEDQGRPKYEVSNEGSEATADMYERAGIGHRMGFGEEPALVVVDFQYGMTDPESPMGSDLTEAVVNTNELVNQAHKSDVQVIFTRCITKHPDAKDIGIWTKKGPSLSELKPGTRWVEIDDRLDVNDTDYILDKKQASAFHETELDSMLTAMGVDTVIVTGCTTSGCVRATVIDSCSHGYRTIVPETCVGDRSERQHEPNMFDMDSKYADVVSPDEVLDYLRTRKTTAESEA